MNFKSYASYDVKKCENGFINILARYILDRLKPLYTNLYIKKYFGQVFKLEFFIKNF